MTKRETRPKPARLGAFLVATLLCACATVPIDSHEPDVDRIVGTYSLERGGSLNLKANGSFEKIMGSNIHNCYSETGRWHVDEGGYIVLDSEPLPTLRERRSGLGGAIRIRAVYEDGAPVPLKMVDYRCARESDFRKEDVAWNALADPSSSERFEWIAVDTLLLRPACRPVELRLTPGVSHQLEDRHADDFTFVYPEGINSFVEGEVYRREGDELIQFRRWEDGEDGRWSEYPFRKHRHKLETLFVDEDEQWERGLRMLETEPALSAFQEQFEVSVFGAGHLSDDFPQAVPVWEGSVSATAESDLYDCELLFPLLGETAQVGLTPGDVWHAIREVASAPFIQEYRESLPDLDSQPLSFCFLAAADRLHWRGEWVEACRRICREEGLPQVDPREWVQFSVAGGWCVVVWFLHPLGTDLYFMDPRNIFEFLTMRGDLDCDDPPNHPAMDVLDLTPNEYACPLVRGGGELEILYPEDPIDWESCLPPW